ncbi:MAG: hypothetical protein H7301_09005 [Cryobacterium sp.]|nr:hypothetical protein [Oligoflexia bacterium]
MDAHELRTPVASLKNLIVTSHKAVTSGRAELSAELYSLSVREVDYFERLVEDLLILAGVSERRCPLPRAFA